MADEVKKYSSISFAWPLTGEEGVAGRVLVLDGCWDQFGLPTFVFISMQVNY